VFESLRARQTAGWRACVVGPNGPEQRGQLTVNVDDDPVAVRRPFEVLISPIVVWTSVGVMVGSL
jgi:hypothetical protein